MPLLSQGVNEDNNPNLDITLDQKLFETTFLSNSQLRIFMKQDHKSILVYSKTEDKSKPWTLFEFTLKEKSLCES